METYPRAIKARTGPVDKYPGAVQAVELTLEVRRLSLVQWIRGMETYTGGVDTHPELMQVHPRVMEINWSPKDHTKSVETLPGAIKAHTARSRGDSPLSI
jgi:hypothetical protein